MKITDQQAELLDVRLMQGNDVLKPGSMIQELQGRVAQNQASSTASDVAGLKADLNALIAKLRAAGLME
ncbi:hypothetical protein [Paenibacillus humicus]|uniref:hypothetical protein n=1 Tax=Paenibacillus humicus TaxID=412861 RepID=UPI000FD8FB4B|nr:hypothetical protein [Paenibacillus humicus]